MQSLFLGLTLALYDPFPYLPPEDICRARYQLTESLLREIDSRRAYLACQETEIERRLGGTTLFLNQSHIKAVRDALESDAADLTALSNCYWLAWHARWKEYVPMGDRVHCARRVRAYLGPVASMPHWWEVPCERLPMPKRLKP